MLEFIVPTHHSPPEPSESTRLTDTNTDTNSGNDLDPYEAIPGAASPQRANTTCVPIYHCRPEATPSANECEYEDVLGSEICNSNGDEKYSGSSEAAHAQGILLVTQSPPV